MIHILIDSAPLDAVVLGVYRSYKEAEDELNKKLTGGWFDPSLNIISWDIVNNLEVDPKPRSTALTVVDNQNASA